MFSLEAATDYRAFGLSKHQSGKAVEFTPTDNSDSENRLDILHVKKPPMIVECLDENDSISDLALCLLACLSTRIL